MVTKKYLAIVLIMGIISGFGIQEAYSSVTLKTMIVNPSKTKTQKAILKGYLPKEAKPEDVLDLGDLKIDYDVGEGLYYVYKEVSLEPGESVMRQIEIKDVWLIQEAELKNLSVRAGEIIERLKGTNYYDAAVNLGKDIDVKQSAIIKRQNEALTALPQTHIAAYRDNVARLDEIKNNIAELEKMFLEFKLAKAKSAEKVSVKASWWIILAVIISLGLLSFIFFIIWHKQAGVLKPAGRKEEEDLSDTE